MWPVKWFQTGKRDACIASHKTGRLGMFANICVSSISSTSIAFPFPLLAASTFLALLCCPRVSKPNERPTPPPSSHATEAPPRSRIPNPADAGGARDLSEHGWQSAQQPACCVNASWAPACCANRGTARDEGTGARAGALEVLMM